MERPVVFGRIIDKVLLIKEADVKLAADAGKQVGGLAAILGW